jgi:hypothetical protein
MALKNNEDAAFLLVDTLEMVLKITAEVYSVVEELMEDYLEKEDQGDMFTLCTLAIDNGIISIVSTLLALTMTTRESKLTLGSDGSIAIEGQSLISALTIEKKELSTPTPALIQTQLIMKIVKLIPDISSFVGEVTTSIMEFAEKEEPKVLEEL